MVVLPIGGEVVLPELAFFTTPGSLTVTVESMLDASIQGSTLIEVAIRGTTLHPVPPPELGEGELLELSGFSFANGVVELFVGEGIAASSMAAADGSFALSYLPETEGLISLFVRGTAADSAQSDVSATYQVIVSGADTAPELRLEPQAFELAVGRARRLQVFVNDSGDFDPAGLVAFSSSDSAVASVDLRGRVTGLSEGLATIEASYRGSTDSVTVEVLAPRLLESSPDHEEVGVALTRETILEFNVPLDPATVTPQSLFAEFGGTVLAARLQVSSDQRRVTLFYDQPLPDRSEVRVTVDGSILRTLDGAAIDAARNGTPGSTGRIDFRTLSLTTVAGTSVCGRVFASELATMPGGARVNVPLAGVTITVDGAPALFATTDAGGNFRLEPAPAGRFFVHVDGQTAGPSPLGGYYPTVGKAWTAEVPGGETLVGDIYLPEIVPGTLQQVSGDEPTRILPPPDAIMEFPDLAGLEITVPTGSLYSDDGTPGGMVGIAPVDATRLPGALPPGLDFDLVFTVQTDGATNFDVPVAVRMPNTQGLPPGTLLALWSFDHDRGEWVVAAQMIVTPDGLWIETLPGQGIRAPGWHGVQVGATASGGRIRDGKGTNRVRPDGTDEREPADGDKEACPASCKTKNAVLLHSGEERLTRVDLVIPGRGETHFAFERQYRSQLDFDGPLGHGWNFTYNEYLLIADNGDVERVNGLAHVDRWELQPDGSYQQPTGFFSTLIRESNGTYVLRERTGRKHCYRADGLMFCLEDRHGNRLLFDYDADGHLLRIIDAFGREIDFQFEATAGRKRLCKIRDFLGREVVYTYDQAGDLVEVRTPVVTGTSTGNDFPDGRTERYTYSSGFSDSRLNHNLLSVTAPEEVANGGPPRMSWTYGEDLGNPLTLDRVLTETEGGTNASGTAAGGTMSFEYFELDPGTPPDPDVPSGRVRVTERNGRVYDYFVNHLQQHIKTHDLTATGLGQPARRPGEPAFYETKWFYNDDAQLLRQVFPEQNEVVRVYGTGSRAAERNVIEVRRIAGPRGGGADLVTTIEYEPLNNRVRKMSGPRGNDPGYAPPLGSQSAARYTKTYTFDYQEGTDPVSDAVKFGIDLSGMPRGLGDQNGDGRTDQVAGDVVRTTAPSVLLVTGSHEAQRLGTTQQDVFTELQWTDDGQLHTTIDPEGNVQERRFYAAPDPDGDGQLVPSLWILRDPNGTGYAEAVIDDARTSPRRSAAAAPTALEAHFEYDPVGNLTAVRDARGVETRFEVTALNETIVTLRGASVDTAHARGELIPGEQALRYVARAEYDHSGRVVQAETENRGSNGTDLGTFVERSWTYDILDNPLSSTVEIDASTDLTTQYAYDANELLIETTAPEGNQIGREYDERNLLFRVTRGPREPRRLDDPDRLRPERQPHPADRRRGQRRDAGSRVGDLHLRRLRP